MKMRLLVISVLLLFGFPFILTKVVDSFGTCPEFFLNGQPPMITGILEDSVSKNNNQYKIICQRYGNAYRFASFYDITKKMPVFSAYKYTGTATGRPHPGSWMIEPQLETLGDEMREPCVNQAFPGNDQTHQELNHGHLFPNAHTADKVTAESTFTMTNTVPQYETFNSGSWLKMEQKVRDHMNAHCQDNTGNTLAYALTGAVSGDNTPLDCGVNIPSHMWTVFCCYNSKEKKWESQAHWAENMEESKAEDKTIATKTLQELEEFLKTKYNIDYKPFINGCK